MKLSGKRTFSLSQLEKFELLVIADALNEYYKLEMNDHVDGSLGTKGEVAVRLLNLINDYRESLS